ncbi:peptide-methionine (S)-S-oxide reductase MsrA [Salinisphaera sp. P385]|uniref:Peptide methionine sulfoxide reductase MsrA n=1 Tax=Spectribacter acetivorans TaxID=3075603 RepID=A0ABU3B5B7_9GAMM|nr:peptide-methionine (S)-S-oxide reductase MsrA [Salinisphaera sp. P385]MDT0617637.1 peptide-methionine (S)-S-oxide reductase MsrA [Salinisphaera sp. P385]
MNNMPDPEIKLPPEQDRGEVVLAAGCFWCVEAVFQALAGVEDVTSGYAGGDADTANYQAVCTGRTGHAEVIRVRYDPAVVSFGTLLKVFFAVAHDPTQLNRQGNDLGPQYRSAVFVADDEQRRVAQAYIEQLDRSGVFGAPIATKLEPLKAFHEAEAYHQDFAINNPSQPYVCMVAQPKLDKLARQFPGHLAGD